MFSRGTLRTSYLHSYAELPYSMSPPPMIKALSSSITKPKCLTLALNWFLSCHDSFLKSNIKQVFCPTKIADVSQSAARIKKLGPGIGFVRRVHVFCLVLYT